MCLEQAIGGATMKRLIATLAIGGILAAIGCNNGTTGGPGAKESDRDFHVTQPEDTFKLSLPTTGTSIKQGEKADVKISISRGKHFDQDVALTFNNVPPGVTITPAHTTLKATEKDVSVAVEAGKSAALGDFVINVVGKPAREGSEGTGTIKLTVNKP
jgi:hypothetical protein